MFSVVGECSPGRVTSSDGLNANNGCSTGSYGSHGLRFVDLPLARAFHPSWRSWTVRRPSWPREYLPPSPGRRFSHAPISQTILCVSLLGISFPCALESILNNFVSVAIIINFVLRFSEPDSLKP